MENVERNEKIEKPVDKSIKNEISLKHEDLENVAINFDLIREMQREVDVETDKILAEQFDDHVKNIMFDLRNKLKPELPAYAINTNITKVKNNCYFACN